jgi:hypothetical protein
MLLHWIEYGFPAIRWTCQIVEKKVTAEIISKRSTTMSEESSIKRAIVRTGSATGSTKKIILSEPPRWEEER